MNFLEELFEQIDQQTRNGRTEVYLKVEDLRRLGFSIPNTEEERVTMDLGTVLSAIKTYRFKQQVKTNQVPLNKKIQTVDKKKDELEKDER